MHNPKKLKKSGFVLEYKSFIYNSEELKDFHYKDYMRRILINL